MSMERLSGPGLGKAKAVRRAVRIMRWRAFWARWRHAAEVAAYLVVLFLAALMWAWELTS